MLEPSNRLLNSLGLEAEGFDRALSESRPKGGRLSRLIMERSEPDSLVSSLAFCVAKSANQCRAELLPSPDERGSLAEDWVRLQGEDVLLVELLVLPTLSPPPLSDGAAVCVVSVLIAAVSPSDFGVVPIPEAAAVRTPLLLVVDCEIPLGALGRTRGLVCRLVQGQLALIPHLPLAECTMSPML